MASRFVRGVLLLCALVGCSDEGPQVPLLFVGPAEGANGAGTVASNPGGIACGLSGIVSTGNCSFNFASGASITLTATPASGSTFTGWGGECAGTDPTCTVTLDASADVTAGFALTNPRTLTVTVTGSGSGTIASTPGGLGCSFNGGTATCTGVFADGAQVVLNAAPAVGSGFTAWGEDCAASASSPQCSVTLSTDQSASAEFVSVSFGGFMASTGDATSGLIVVSIPVASAKVVSTAPPDISLAAAAAGVPAVGTVTYLGGESFPVAGIYDTAQKQLHLLATDFTVDAFFQNDVFGGSFADNGRNIFGVVSLTSAAASSPPATFCGSYTTDGSSLLSDSGSWNLVVSGDTLVTGLSASNQEQGTAQFQGQLRSGTINAQIQDGSTDPVSAVTGTTSDGTTFTGTYTRQNGEFTGTWTASSATCQ